MLKYFKEDIQESCQSKIWFIRFPVIIYLIYVLHHELTIEKYSTILWGVDAGIHEMGHFAFVLLGNRLLHVAGGTIFQLSLPLVAIIMFLRQKDYFGISFAISWIGINLFEVSTYMKDAQEQALPLLVPFGKLGQSSDGMIHDWNYLFTHFGVLEMDDEIAMFVKILATIFMITGIWFGSYILWKMKKSKN